MWSMYTCLAASTSRNAKSPVMKKKKRELRAVTMTTLNSECGSGTSPTPSACNTTQPHRPHKPDNLPESHFPAARNSQNPKLEEAHAESFHGFSNGPHSLGAYSLDPNTYQLYTIFKKTQPIKKSPPDSNITRSHRTALRILSECT